MSLVPPLQVVPIGAVLRHEGVDPKRVTQIRTRITSEGVQVNPVICIEAAGRYVVLDGATRTEAVLGIGLPYIIVQVVDPEAVTLETWHHVLRDCPSDQVMTGIADYPGVLLTDAVGTPQVTTADGETHSVLGADMSPNATMTALVDSYIGRWETSRIIDPQPSTVTTRFPDWSVIVEFPPVRVEDVVKAAIGQDLLPAGVTRFLVPERVLRLKAPLAILESGDQAELDRLVEERSTTGRVRRYEETVVVLDD